MPDKTYKSYKFNTSNYINKSNQSHKISETNKNSVEKKNNENFQESINKSTNIIGIYGISNGFEHDHSVSYFKNGKITLHYPLERISGVKYDAHLQGKYQLIFNNHNFPVDFLFSANTQLCFVDSFSPMDVNLLGIQFHTDNANISQPIYRMISHNYKNLSRNPLVISHEIAHIFSNEIFYGNFPPNTLGIHIDGGASYCCESAWDLGDLNGYENEKFDDENYRNNNKIKLIEGSWSLHDDVNNFSTNHLTQIILGMFNRPGADLAAPGKLMGLAAYGHYDLALHDWLERNNWFAQTTPKALLKRIKDDWGIEPNLNNPLDPFLVNIAKTIQKNLSIKVLDFIRSKKKETNAKNLAYSGGVALNIVINSEIARELQFERIFIPPCCNDTGLPLGACAYYYTQLSGENNSDRIDEINRIDRINQINGTDQKKRIITPHSPFLCNSDLDPNLTPPPDVIQKTARILADGKIIAVAVGNGEIGPRALVHRSILGIPSTIQMKTRISTEIKKRESYRPVAPVILDSIAQKAFDPWFDYPANEFMLLEYNVRPEFTEIMPAVVHVDGTVRAQIVKEQPVWQSSSELKFLYDLLTMMWENFGIPCLINTSFNLAGKPIVHSKKDALDSAKQMGIYVLLLEDKLLFLK